MLIWYFNVLNAQCKDCSTYTSKKKKLLNLYQGFFFVFFILIFFIINKLTKYGVLLLLYCQKIRIDQGKRFF